MEFRVRPVTADDVPACGRILCESFRRVAEEHRFRSDFPSVEFAVEFAGFLTSCPGIFGIVAESEGRVIGSNFLSEQTPIRSVGPVSVDPDVQARGVGRALMEAVLERGRGARGIRLVQDAFNTASLSLYATLGFEVKEPLVVIEGRVGLTRAEGVEVRPMMADDHAACAALCRRVHGFDRVGELAHPVPGTTPFVAVRAGRVVAYASAPTRWPVNHAVAESDEDLESLLAGACAASERKLSLLLPTRQGRLFRWCLAQGMRVVKPMTLMAMGEYQEPTGAHLPSVGF